MEKYGIDNFLVSRKNFKNFNLLIILLVQMWTKRNCYVYGVKKHVLCAIDINL